MPTLPKIETTKPLNAVAGVADLAYETVKDLATDLQKRVDGYRSEATTKLTDARSKATEKATAYRTQATEKATAAKSTVTGFDPKSLPALAKEQYTVLPEKLKTTVKAKLDETTGSATGTYDKLATRGETFVAKFKKSEAAEAPAEAPKTEAPKAEAPKAEAPKAEAPAEKPAPAKKAPAKKTAAKKA
jgi:heparin binding hemagglutinin HbhA